ncbi:metallophosphoesterase family protein [bacterium]|nr:metallophosphoesterase family protein [bacterium]
MKIGFLSDIHANLEALETAISILHNENVDKIYCIGDIIGYGANPASCIDIIEKECDGIVAGNHDWASIGKTDITYFNMYGRKAILWTAKKLSPYHKSFLAELPLFLANRNWCIVHSTPIEPVKWHYVFTPTQALHQFNHFDEKVCFIGHSHSPIIFTDKGGYDKIFIPQDNKTKLIKLADYTRYIINVGSVGQPRDGDSRGSLAIYDADEKTVEFVRFEYQIAKTQQKILDAELPKFLAERLSQGI